MLEIGSGAGQCSRWLRSQGGGAFGLDVCERQLQHSRRIDEATGTPVPSVCATASALPFADDCLDVVFSSFGALQFVADADGAGRRGRPRAAPRGGFAFSVTHPVRWSMPDDAGRGRAGASPAPTGTARRTSRRTRTASRGTSSTTAPSATGSRCWPAQRFMLTALHEPQWPEGPRADLGRLGPDARPAGARHRDLRGAPARALTLSPRLARMRSPSRAPSLMAGGASIALAIAVMNLATYASTMLAARLLGPREYGAFAAFTALLLVLGVLMLGLQTAGARRVAADPEHVGQIEGMLLRVTYRCAWCWRPCASC